MSDTTVYAVASGKGGVGKTTTTVNLGTALAGAGERVAIVDADLGMANLAGFVSLSPDGPTLHGVLAGDAEIPEATYEVADGIAAVPSGTELDEFAAADAEGLGDAVDRLRGEFDYVLLDVGAGVSHESVLPLGVADEVLLVSTPEPASVQDVRKTIDLVDRSGGSVAGLVITRGRPEGGVSHEDIASRLGVDLLGSIPEDPTARDSVYAGTPLVVHEPEAPAAKAYRRLAATLADGVQADADAGAAAGADAATDADNAGSVDGEPDETDDADEDTDAGEDLDLDDTEQDAEINETTDADDADAAASADADADGVADAESAADLDADPAAADDAGDEAADPEEPASETSVEDAISEIEADSEADEDGDDAPDEDGDDVLDGAVAVGDAEAADDEADETGDVEGAVTIPDAEGDAAEQSSSSPASASSRQDAEAQSTSSQGSQSQQDADEPLELDDDAIPFSGDDADAAASADDGELSADNEEDESAGEEADDDDAADDEEDGGFLGGIF